MKHVFLFALVALMLPSALEAQTEGPNGPANCFVCSPYCYITFDPCPEPPAPCWDYGHEMDISLSGSGYDDGHPDCIYPYTCSTHDPCGGGGGQSALLDAGQESELGELVILAAAGDDQAVTRLLTRFPDVAVIDSRRSALLVADSCNPDRVAAVIRL